MCLENLVFSAVALACVLVYVACNTDRFLEDLKTLVEVLRDNPKARRAEAENENAAFMELMRKADNQKCKPGKGGSLLALFHKDPRKQESVADILLQEARDNLKHSYDLRSHENQTVLSMTAVIGTMFGALVYLVDAVAGMPLCGNMFCLFITLALLCLATLVVAAAFLIESFRPTFLIPNSAEKNVREILDKGGNVATELKYRLITQCGVRSKVNEHSNILKSKCWDATRRYMRYAGVFLLLMLFTWSAYKLW